VRSGVGRRAAAVATLALVAAILVPTPARADEARARQWHLGFLNVAEAHKHSQGEGITVAVVDSGVDATHPDLTGVVGAGTDFHGGDGRRDPDGHGTAMAGLIAARGRPGGAGALGIAPAATILPVYRGSTDVVGLADRAIDWAVEHGARVLCLAFGGAGGTRLEEAVQRALAADVVVVAGVGNRPEATSVAAPARYPGVLAVAGVDANGNHAEISATGPETALAAPAVDVWSTATGGGYRKGTGTSDATAIIAGAAALVRAKYPHLKAPEVIHRLTATAIDKGKPGRDDEYGYGIVDLVAALTKDIPPAGAGGGDSKPEASAKAEPRRASKTVLGLALAGFLFALAAAGAGVFVVMYRRSRRAGFPGGG
jgi:type VII secretion-associated serine protease mycosin